ncbi:unnamed protein product [Clavelina lepadiformis]|uniref:Poly [ADP-ribose] polymerase n=1 Tax=Clavelina lepadiformis TaxID=159417 RepID=A0ABP0GZH7_CLALP
MEEEASLSRQVLINGLPEGFGLSRTRDLVLDYLGCEDAVTNIDFRENIDGTKRTDSAVVSLRNKPDVNILVEIAVIVATFRRQQHNLKITRSRPRAQVTKAVVYDTGTHPDSALDRPLKQVTWQDLLQTDPNLFGGFSNKCVLIKNIPDDKSSSEIRRHFENPNTSGGGPIAKMYRLPDGLFIAFCKEESAKSILNFTENRIDTRKLPSYMKPVPEVYNDRFVIEGQIEQKTFITELVQCCVSADDTVNSVDEVEGSDRCIVSVKSNANAVDIKDIMKKLEKIELENVNLKTQRLCRTDCLKVSDLEQEISNDKIQLTFMNKRLTNGGDVTMIERDKESNVAYVYFADYRDGENVLKKSQEEDITIGNNVVCITPCYFKTCFEENKTKGGVQSIRRFEYVPEVDDDIIELIMGSNLLEALNKDFENLAKISFIQKRTPVVTTDDIQYYACFQPLQVSKQTERKTQVNFESDCVNLINKFFEKFMVQTSHFGSSKLAHIREEHSWNNRSSIIKMKLDEDASAGCVVFIRWNYPQNGSLKMIALGQNISSAWKWLQSKAIQMESSETYEDWEIEVIKECGILADMKKKYEGTVNIIDKERRLTFTGLKTEIHSCRAELFKQIIKIKSTSLSFLGQPKLKFLTDILEGGRNVNDMVTQVIREEFRKLCIKGALVFTSEASLKYMQENDLDEAQEILADLIHEHCIKFSGLSSSLQSVEWKTLERNLCSSGALNVQFDNELSTITLVGLKKYVENGKHRLEQYVKENLSGKEIVKVSYLVAQFMSTFPDEAEVHEKLKNVEWYLTKENSGGILIQGKAPLVKAAKEWMMEKVATIETKQFSIPDPGMPGYFRSETGKQFLKTTQAISKCVILVDTEKCPQWECELDPKMLGSQRRNPVPIITTKITNTDVTINVIKNDITEHVVDAIVNASNNKLELRPAGVSGSILRKGGKVIQDEMNTYYREGGGNLPSGLAAVTTAGSLPCKKIIHTIGPVWSNDQERWARLKLKECIDASLFEAEHHNLSSIAIPAVSCGVFGGKAEICTRIIVRAVFQHLESQSSSVKRVDLVEVSNAKILEQFKTQVAKIIAAGGKLDADDEFEAAPKKSYHWGDFSMFTTKKPEAGSHKRKQPDTNRQQPFHPLTVRVTQGDILNSDLDVIVNLVGERFDLTGGILSQKVIAKAGQSVVQECNSKPIYATKHYKVTSGGQLSCKNIVHMVSDQRSKPTANLLKVLEVVDQKLKMSSLALPAIGTGNVKLSAADAAKAIREALEKFAKTKPNNLRRIDVIVFQNVMLHDFQSTINVPPISTSEGTRVDAMESIKTGTLQVSSIIPKQGVGRVETPVKLFLCAASRFNINLADKRIENHIKEKSLTKCIDDTAVAYLDDTAQKQLIDIGENRSILLRKTDNASGKDKIIISGLKDHVIEAYDEAYGIVQEYKDILRCADYVKWQYYDNMSQVREDFSLRDSCTIENACKHAYNGTVRLSIDSDYRKRTYVINLDKMKETCRETGAETDVFRTLTVASDEAFPKSWSSMGGVPWKLDKLATHTPEYQDVLSEFTSKGLQLSPSSTAQIERIQNPTLYKQYLAQKSKVDARMRADNVTNPVSLKLFHGTQKDICPKIYRDGFDRRYAGENGTMYGWGVYFATTSQYSHRFATPDNNGQRRMFLAEVVTGEYAQGRRDTKHPPPKSGSQTELCDSVVDNVASPTIYVVFKDASVYPLYLLTY